jgi:hypothetical protein
VACGSNSSGQCNIPALEGGRAYTQAVAGWDFTALLVSDGTAVTCGSNSDGQCNIPPLDDDVIYRQIVAGARHTVLLRSNGTATACGANNHGQRSLPDLDEHMIYTQVVAGRRHTVLLQGNGAAVACGYNRDAQCSIDPTVRVRGTQPELVLQSWLDGDSIVFVYLSGAEFWQANAELSLQELLGQLMRRRLAASSGPDFSRLDVVLPGGRLLSDRLSDPGSEHLSCRLAWSQAAQTQERS